MNSEIERLAKEADFTICRNWGTVIADEHRLAKFAALIADECAKECESTHQRRAAVGNRQGFNAIMDCVDAIRAKFALSHKGK